MKALVVLPTYNERENIEDIIKAILNTAPVDVLVVDDNSPDGTGEIVDRIVRTNPRVHVIHRPEKRGLGTAYIEAFRWALKRSYEAVIEMDADFSHDPKDIPRLLEAAKKYDLVIGSRYINGISVVNWPLKRLILSYLANLYARKVTGVPIRDLTGGFKCFRRHVLETINLDKIHSDGYAFQIEMNFHAWHNGFSIKEIPIIFVERRAGASKMSKHIIWEAFWLVIRLRLMLMCEKIKNCLGLKSSIMKTAKKEELIGVDVVVDGNDKENPNKS
ncbi:MAG: polyprenol monophosphomannose synthase [Candidatus Hydrothermota bacterium]|nr:MAG: polyprenol monophosphomannose synthase [Candidatus Hydrothermae bacterium]